MLPAGFRGRAARVDPADHRPARRDRDKVRAQFLQDKLEQYKNWEEALNEIQIPYIDTINLPDEDYWRQITMIRNQRTSLIEAGTQSISERELRDRLSSERIPGLTIDDEESLIAVVDAMKAITGLPLIVDPLAEEEAINEGVLYKFDFRNSLRVEEALNLIADMSGEEVTWTIRHDAVLFTTKEKARGELMIYNHDIQDLIFGLTDFLGPRIDRLRLLDDLEDEDGGSPFGAHRREADSSTSRTTWPQLVQENVAVGTWEDDGISITVEGGNMVVVHTPEVATGRCASFLEEMRRFSASLVTIESKFLTIAGGLPAGDRGRLPRPRQRPETPTPTWTTSRPSRHAASRRASWTTSGTAQNSGKSRPRPVSFYDDGADGDFKRPHGEHLRRRSRFRLLTNMGGLTAQWTYLDDIQISAILRAGREELENLELINDQILSACTTPSAPTSPWSTRSAYVQDFDVEVAQFQAIADPVINVLTEGIVLDVRPDHPPQPQAT